jgi:hypothetical protein
MTRVALLLVAAGSVACGTRSDLTEIVDDASVSDVTDAAEIVGDGQNCATNEGPIDACDGGPDAGAVIRCGGTEQCLYNVGGTAVWACCSSSDSADSGCRYASPHGGFGCPY